MPALPRPAWLLPLLLAAAGSAAAAADEYRLDPVHTRVAFRVDHAGLSRAIGTFSGSHGRLRFDPGDWASAELDVTVPVASLEIGDGDWRDKVLGRAFLDAEAFPEARFVSTRVEAIDASHARVFGQLSLRGASREVVLEVRLNAVKRHPLTFRRSAGFSATATLRRSEFGIDAWAKLVGDEVELIIEAEAQRSRPAGDGPQATEDADAAAQ